MAKNTMHFVMESISNVVWLPWNNYARHDAKIDSEEARRNIGVALANEGWLTKYSVEVVPLSEEGKAAAVEYLQNQYKILESLTEEAPFKDAGKTTKVSAGILLKAFKMRWMKDGKVKAPKYEAVFGFQRGSSIDLGNAYLLATNREMLTEIPVHIVEYKNDADRIRSCIEENFSKDALLNDVTNHWPSIIKSAKALYDATGKAATEADITRALSGGDQNLVGRGQKAHKILVLDSRFPQLNLVAKIVNAPTTVENGRTVDKGQEYGASLDRAKLIALEGGTRSTPTNPDKPVTQADVEAYFADPAGMKGEAKRPMTWKALARIAENHPNMFVRYVLQACQNDKTTAENLNALDKIAKDSNELLVAAGLCADGKPKFPKA
jgi:hypothetical protein